MSSSPTFSLTRRHREGRALSSYVQGQLRLGRPLEEVLDDDVVGVALAERPELFEDLMDDRELREVAAPPQDAAVVVIGYDGSAGARRAVAQAARVLPGARALVVTVWDAGGGGRLAAWRTAEEGAALARALGLLAEPLAAAARGETWAALASCALQWEADLVVIGTRARTCRHALAGGSVAHRAISERRLPVLTVPAPAAAAADPVQEEPRSILDGVA